MTRREPWEFADNVTLGMKVLDQKCPGWVAFVDLEKLDLRSCTSCVLGQTYGNYLAGLLALGLWPAASSGVPATHGFKVLCDRGWGALTQAWKQAIDARRKESE